MNLPVDFINQMKEMLGEAYDAFESEYDKPYFSALRVNSRKITTDSLRELLSLGNDRVAWEKRGFYYDDSLRPGKSPLHEAGLYYIQEPSAMLPVSLLDVDDSGLKVLDLCAAPGGKTTQIADYMKGKGLLVANEIMPQRAKILSENIERMGVSNAIVISADPRDISDRFAGFFDRVLVDAPCSGEGMFRKHPEAMDEWSIANVSVCAQRQSWVMDCAAKMLKPGGRMVYSTCTFNMQEDEHSVDEFLKRHPEFALVGDMHRIYPHIHRGEGHFGAALIKCPELVADNMSEDENRKPRSKKGSGEKSASKDQYKPYADFAESCLSQGGLKKLDNMAQSGIYLMFGDQLYLAPDATPTLKGMKVLRPGLHLGTVIKDRFEPSHALALFLKPEDVIRVVNMDYELSVRYLKGEALQGMIPCGGCDFAEGNTDKMLSGKCQNGWTLALTSGYSIGWGKITNGTLKNHYPKGLRWMI